MIISKPLKHENIDSLASHYIQEWNNANTEKPSLSTVKDELNLLLNYNKYISYFLNGPNIAFTFITDDVKFGNINLNKFKITLGCNLKYHNLIYSIRALEPVYSKINKYSYHPHVEGNDLCLGDNSDLLYNSLIEARFEDSIRLINNLIHTFNKDSAYANPAHWNGYKCENCETSSGNHPYESKCCEVTQSCLSCSKRCKLCCYNSHIGCTTDTKCCKNVVCKKCVESSRLFVDDKCPICHSICILCNKNFVLKKIYDYYNHHASTTCEECCRKHYFSGYERFINGNS